MAIRGFVVLSAIGLVGAFAVAAMMPPDLTLGALLVSMDPQSLMRLHERLLHHGAPLLWSRVLMPFLVRPGWLPLVMLGVVAGGVAYSLNQADRTRQSTRRSN